MPTLAARTSSVIFPDISTGLNSAEWARGTVPLAIRRLRAVVLLGGAVRRTAFHDGIGRPPMMLPLPGSQRLIDLWAEALTRLHESFALPTLHCQIVVDRPIDIATELPSTDGVNFSVQADPSEFRGTGGLLADIAFGFDAADYLLVAPASAVPPADLIATVRAAARIGTDVSVLIDSSGRPLDLFLVRCGALNEIPRIGFIDFKEQGIPLIAKRHAVGIARCQTRIRPSARTAAGYLDLLRDLAVQEFGLKSPFAERWPRAFGIVEEGAEVASSACLHDCVVLKGGFVGTGATVARSIVCAGGRVRAHATVIGRIVTASGSFEISEK